MFCTTRYGGTSQAPYDSFNLGDHVGDLPQAVFHNRQSLSEQLRQRPVFMSQVHGSVVAQLHHDTPDGQLADACFTLESGLACTIMVADCLPVLFYLRSARVVAAAHAGWRGALDGVVQAAVDSMVELGARPDRMVAAVGPCIGPGTAIGPRIGPAIGPRIGPVNVGPAFSPTNIGPRIGPAIGPAWRFSAH